MAEHRVSFMGSRGQQLGGRLAQPPGEALGWVLLAHCFTCGKDLRAARLLTRAMCQDGWGVLRFDFTGIGESEGDFADKTFSGNVDDLVAAADWMAENVQAPVLLVGHSWGGAAVIAAGPKIPSVRAVATIGAPSDPGHVTDLFEDSLDEIEEKGTARVTLAGRAFTIGKQLVEDVAEQRLERILQEGGRALMVMHSPVDRLVGIEHATRLFKFARHPKSFVSLDRADHMLTDPDDANWVGRMIAGWACRMVDVAPRLSELRDGAQGPRGEVDVAIGARDLTVEVSAGPHHWVADEPTGVGGNDRGPTPYELLFGSLGACTAMTMQMYAKRKQWPLHAVDVQLKHERSHGQDAQAKKQREFHVHRTIRMEGDLDQEQRARLMSIADRCPVHRTLTGEVTIHSIEVEPEQ